MLDSTHRHLTESLSLLEFILKCAQLNPHLNMTFKSSRQASLTLTTTNYNTKQTKKEELEKEHQAVLRLLDMYPKLTPQRIPQNFKTKQALKGKA